MDVTFCLIVGAVSYLLGVFLGLWLKNRNAKDSIINAVDLSNIPAEGSKTVQLTAKITFDEGKLKWPVLEAAPIKYSDPKYLD